MICICCDAGFGSGGGGGGGGESLAETLVIGNVTGGTDIEVTTGDAIVGQTSLVLASTAGDVQLTPAGGTANVGIQAILTTVSSVGGGTSIVRAKGAGGVNGADQALASLTSTLATIAITAVGDTVNLEVAGGATPTWAQVLLAGNVSGGTDPTISVGDEILGVQALNLRAQGDGYGVILRSADGSSALAGQTRDLEGYGGNSTGGAVQGGRILLFGGSGDANAPGGTFRGNGGTGGSTSGTGGPAWIVGGQGGAPNGDGGQCLIQGGDGQGFGAGGPIDLEAGDGFLGGAVNISAGTSTGGNGSDATINGGIPAPGNNDGGDVRLVPRAATGVGTSGGAFVGTETILTRFSNLGGGAQVLAAKALSPSVDGARLDARSIIGTSPIVATQNANDITLSAPTVALVGAGSEIGLQDTITGDLTFTQRLMTLRHSQSAMTQMRINIAAGSVTVDSRARSITGGNTTTIGRRSIQGQSTLGTNVSATATANFTTTNNTFTDITTTSGIVLNAGDWVVTFSCECIPAA